MQKTIQQIFFDLVIIALEFVVITYLYYELNSCDRQSRCYQTVLRSQMLLGEVFPNWIFFLINLKLGLKCRLAEFVSVWEP